MILLGWFIVLALLGAPALAQTADPGIGVANRTPAVVVSLLTAAVISGDDQPVRSRLTEAARRDLSILAADEARSGRLASLGAVATTTTAARTQDAGGTTLVVVALTARGTATWTLRFEDASGRIAGLRLAVVVATGGAVPSRPEVSDGPRSYRHAYRRRPPAEATPIPPEPKAAPPVEDPVAQPAIAAVADDRTVEFLLATTREVEDGEVPRFLPARGEGLTYGIVRVHVPEDHRSGQVERPRTFGLLGFTIYEEKLDQKHHFVVTGARLIGEDDFMRFATGDPRKEALIFVHGFNNSFEASAYRFAQILYDLHYQRPAILFSWASKGSVVDYLYDKDSAEIARDRFAELVRTLQARGVEKISVIAHSMGNQLAVAALAQSATTARPDRVEQLIMAAPDMDAGFLTQIAPRLTRVARGVTLYACSTDRALQASKRAAGGMARAGDVPAAGPLVLKGIDTIDVSALGQDWLGLNHDVFATNRSVMDDIGLLLGAGAHPPRLPAVVGMPDGATPPAYWRFVP